MTSPVDGPLKDTTQLTFTNSRMTVYKKPKINRIEFKKLLC